MTTRPPGWRRVFRHIGARAIEQDVDDEIAFHLAMRAERLRKRGLGEAYDAEQLARTRFGDVDQIRDECVAIDHQNLRQQRAADLLEDLMQDLAFAFRGLRRAPGFAFAALITLALGIGAATAIFSVAYGVLLRPLPFSNPDRLVDLAVNLSGTGSTFGSFSAPEYVDLTRMTRSFASIGAWSSYDRTLGGDGRPERVTTASVTASLMNTLGVRAASGRTFVPEDDAPSGARVILLSDALWRRRFGADPAIVDKRVELDGVSRTVIGVLPPGISVRGAEAYIPLGLNPAKLPGRGAHYLRVIARLKSGVSLEQAREDLMGGFVRQTMQENPTNYGKRGFTSTARTLRESWFGDAGPLMRALVGTVLLLLLLAAVNVANLLLVRAEARQREMGVRVAMGASRHRLVRQLLTESVVLATLGAMIGIPLAALSVRSLLAINPGVVPPGAGVSIDLGVLAAVVGVVVIAAFVTGVAPALRAGATDVRSIISTGSAAGAKSGSRLRGMLVGTEVALATAMLIGAGLVGRSFQRLLSVDPGFSAQGALVMDVALPAVRYDTSTKVLEFYRSAVERMRGLPGVTSAAALTTLPLGSGTIQWSLVLDGRPNSATEVSTPFIVSATTDVVRALGVRMIRGRAFNEQDTELSSPVTVVNETLAREYWPGEDPIGKRVHLSDPTAPWMTVVGVAHDVRPEALSEKPKSMYYVLTPQFAKMVGFADRGMTLVLRTSGDPSMLVAGARSAIHDIDPELALSNVQTLAAVVQGSVARPRFAASVLGAFGLSA